ncbi:1,2-dihydroxy-3-keto-5-methylthiopentene dioxygenase [Sorangium sp. So ce124]|uniref:1,2-dihydroxy-3-keto-5-methylthiopentene dioxygenase n=1 Tax=Sorangium sp. So ce124 TaxID=3133280 RepID=UPI003F5FF7AB
MRAIRMRADGEGEATEAELQAEGIQCGAFDPGAAALALQRVIADRGWTEHEDVRRDGSKPRDEAESAREADEHCHLGDEVRLFVEGHGCYDVRCMNDEWLRIWVGAGDLIAVPARRYHRFMASKASAIRYLQPYGGRHLLMQLYRVSDDRTRAM